MNLKNAIKIGNNIKSLTEWCLFYGINSTRVTNRMRLFGEPADVALRVILSRTKERVYLSDINVVTAEEYNVYKEEQNRIIVKQAKPKRKMYRYFVPTSSGAGVWKQRMLTADELEEVKHYARNIKEI